MTDQRFYDGLVQKIETELTHVGCILTTVRRREIGELLDRIDRVKTHEDVVLLNDELTRKSWKALDPERAFAPPWLAAAECA